MSGAGRNVPFPNTAAAVSPAFFRRSTAESDLLRSASQEATTTMRRLMGIAGAGLVWCTVTFVGNPVAVACSAF
jgi:hypothetical protein